MWKKEKERERAWVTFNFIHIIYIIYMISWLRFAIINSAISSFFLLTLLALSIRLCDIMIEVCVCFLFLVFFLLFVWFLFFFFLLKRTICKLKKVLCNQLNGDEQMPWSTTNVMFCLRINSILLFVLFDELCAYVRIGVSKCVCLCVYRKRARARAQNSIYLPYSSSWFD